MIRQQRWTTMLCPGAARGDACQFTEEWDDSQDANARTTRVVSRARACTAHAALSAQASHAACLDESRRWCNVLTAAQQARADIGEDKLIRSFDANRVLHVLFDVSVGTSDKARIQAALDLEHGPGKVVIDNG